MRIRDYRPEDAVAVSRLYEASVRELGGRGYSAEQVAAWAGVTPTPENLDARMADGRFRLLAVDEQGGLLAFVDAEPDGHIDFLYAAPEAAGKGAARAAYEAAEARLRVAGCERLFAEASELARPFFERQGFSTTHRRDFEVGGVAIHNWAVEKRLP